MRIVTVGPLPSEWGGANARGVATFHRLLLGQLIPENSIAVITSADSKAVETIRPPKAANADWYADQVHDGDAVWLLHVSYPMAIHHAMTRPVPSVGAVQSRTPVLHGKRQVTLRGLSGADVLVFLRSTVGSRDSSWDSLIPQLPRLCPTLSTTSWPNPWMSNALGRGAVFVGAPKAIEQPELAEQACRALGGPFQIVSGKSRQHVREALLSAEVLCFPGKSESIGIAYTEAASCGTLSRLCTIYARTLGPDRNDNGYRSGNGCRQRSQPQSLQSGTDMTSAVVHYGRLNPRQLLRLPRCFAHGIRSVRYRVLETRKPLMSIVLGHMIEIGSRTMAEL